MLKGRREGDEENEKKKGSKKEEGREKENRAMAKFDSDIDI
jgi:hypothetical protein